MLVSDNRTLSCFHCGLPVPDGCTLQALVAGEPRPMCCAGCKAAAETIVACGLDRFYAVRSGQAPRPDERDAAGAARFVAFDDPVLQQRFVTRLRDGRAEATLLLDGIACAACCWLIERRLSALEGVASAAINYATQTARVQWNPVQLRFSDILLAIAQLGYHAAPYDAAAAARRFSRERNAQLRRIGIAGLFGMQIMMLSAGLYLGADAGVDPGIAPLLRWAAAVLVLPVLLYSAAPFFRGAWRDFRARSPGMDVPVALGIAIAFAGSLHALAMGRGHIYFDSIAMFVFILLCGRFVEFGMRRRAAAEWDRLQRIQPATAVRLRPRPDGSDAEETVPVSTLQVGDEVRVRPGETVPVDGTIVSGASSLNEALMTGESRPVRHEVGHDVIGGSINIESPLRLRTTRISAESRLAQIARLARDTEMARAAPEYFSDLVARRFIARLLLIAAGVALFWWLREPARWIPVTVSVLVITCPCALALAAPAAVAAATGALLRLGMLIRSAHGVETLGKSTLFVFDKTGTLTEGELRLIRVHTHSGTDAREALALAAAIEAGSEHPVGRAIRRGHPGNPPAASDIRTTAGEGVAGFVRGREYFLGTPGFVARASGGSVPVAPGEDADGPSTRVVLADRTRPLAQFLMRDSLRSGAESLVRSLQAAGRRVRMLSGDGNDIVALIAAQAGIGNAEGELLPAQKVERLKRWHAGGDVICVVGDGVNDAPVLAAADVSVAMGGGADLARASADILLLENRLDALRAGIAVAHRTLRVMRQNVAWAIGYNVIAVPLAAAGFVTPWMAALGMSLSSLLVVLNAARLGRDVPQAWLPTGSDSNRGAGESLPMT